MDFNNNHGVKEEETLDILSIPPHISVRLAVAQSWESIKSYVKHVMCVHSWMEHTDEYPFYQFIHGEQMCMATYALRAHHNIVLICYVRLIAYLFLTLVD